jgi:hypothetical protein
MHMHMLGAVNLMRRLKDQGIITAERWEEFFGDVAKL